MEVDQSKPEPAAGDMKPSVSTVTDSSQTASPQTDKNGDPLKKTENLEAAVKMENPGEGSQGGATVKTNGPTGTEMTTGAGEKSNEDSAAESSEGKDDDEDESMAEKTGDESKDAAMKKDPKLYNYLNNSEFTSEIFKIEINNLPKKIGFGVSSWKLQEIISAFENTCSIQIINFFLEFKCNKTCGQLWSRK